MKTVFFTESAKQASAKQKVYGDDLVSRQTIVIRDAVSLGIKGDGCYIEIEGSDDALKKAKKLLEGLAVELKVAEKEKVLKIIQEQEDSASAGFGAIFG